MAWKMKNASEHVKAMDRIRNEARYAEVLQEAHGDLGYALWLAFVNQRLRPLGISYSDLADFSSRDLYEAGVSPREGAEEALQNDDMYSALLEGA